MLRCVGFLEIPSFIMNNGRKSKQKVEKKKDNN